MPLPTSALSYPTQATIDTWNVRDAGVRDGSSPTETFELNNNTTTKKFLVAWAKRFDFMKYMIGYGIVWNDSGTTRISRLLPRAHADSPKLIATKITRVKGLQFASTNVTTVTGGYAADPTRCFDHPAYQWSDAQGSTYKDAEIEIFFEQPRVLLVEDSVIYTGGHSETERYVEVGDFDGGAEYLTLPGAMMMYARSSGSANPHGVSIPFSIGKVMPKEKFALIWKRLPVGVWDPGAPSDLYKFVYGDGGSIKPAIGRVNKVLFYGKPIGTVLLEAVKPQLNLNPIGTDFEWELRFDFQFDPYLWNNKYYFKAGGGAGGDNGFYFVTAKGTVGSPTYEAPGSVSDDASIYNEVDLNRLFKVVP